MDIDKIKFRLKNLGEPKQRFNQLKYNCPICEAKGSSIDKYNLEVNINTLQFNCWACNYHGHINKLISEQGLGKDFKFENIINFSKEENKEYKIEEPLFLNQKYTEGQKKHFLYRGVPIDKLKKNNVYNVYSGKEKGMLYFRSYNISGELNYSLLYDLVNKKYIKPRGIKNEIMFQEGNLDYNFPITITEGIWDYLSTINSFPMLGLKLNDRMKFMLSNKDCILLMDEFVINRILLKLEKELREICSSLTILKIPQGLRDPSYCLGTRNNIEFKNNYLRAIQNIANGS